jgi:hypothetical protein
LCITEQQQNGSYLIALLPATAAWIIPCGSLPATTEKSCL